MSGVSLVLVIGLLNLCLGYALAVRLGYGPPSLEAAWEVASPKEPPEQQLDKLEESVEVPLDDLIHELISGTDEPAASAWGKAPDDPLPKATEPEPGETGKPFGADEQSAPGRLLAMHRQVAEHLDWLVDLDTRLRRTVGEYELFTLLAWIQELKEGCQLQLRERTAAVEAFGAPFEEHEELGESGGKLAAAVAEHSARLEAAVGHADRLDIKGDPGAAASRLLEKIDRVQNAAHELRDRLEEAFLALARSAGYTLAIEESLRIDPLTQFPNRIGLETLLARWWQAAGQETQSLSAALFDLDNFAEVNESHGLKACDGIVRATAECIAALAAENETLARYGGKRMVLVMFDAGAASAAGRAEAVRQSIQKTRFTSGQATIHVTLSGGVAAAFPRESSGGSKTRWPRRSGRAETARSCTAAARPS